MGNILQALETIVVIHTTFFRSHVKLHISSYAWCMCHLSLELAFDAEYIIEKKNRRGCVKNESWKSC